MPARKPLRSLAVVLFALPKAFVVECQVVGRDLGAQFVAVRDLQAACRSITTGRADIVVASKKLPSWDQDIAKQHAEKERVPILFIDPDETTELRSHLLSWEQRARTASRSLSGTRARFGD